MGHHVVVQCVGDVCSRMDAVYSECNGVSGDKSYPQGHAQTKRQPLHANVSGLGPTITMPHRCGRRSSFPLPPNPVDPYVGCVRGSGW